MLKRLSMGQKIMFRICVVVLIVYWVVNGISLFQLHSYSKQEAINTAVITSKYNAENVERNFKIVLTIAKDFANQVETMAEESKTSRDLVIKTMKNALDIHENLFGVAIMFEPNAFDGKDSLYKNTTGSNLEGQFMPYATRGEAGGHVIELCHYNHYTKEQTIWYDYPKERMQIYFSEPTTYPVQGSSQTVASIVLPIIRDDVFVGVISLDTSLDYLQKEIEMIKPMGGYSEIISTKGVCIANGQNPLKIMTNVIQDEQWEAVIKDTSVGKEFSRSIYSSDIKEQCLAVFSQIHFDGSEQYWTYVSIIPESNIYEEFQSSLYMIIIVGIILTGAVVYCNYHIISKDL